MGSPPRRRRASPRPRNSAPPVAPPRACCACTSEAEGCWKTPVSPRSSAPANGKTPRFRSASELVRGQVVQVLSGEGASHSTPFREPCAGHREVGSEASKAGYAGGAIEQGLCARKRGKTFRPSVYCSLQASPGCCAARGAVVQSQSGRRRVAKSLRVVSHNPWGIQPLSGLPASFTERRPEGRPNRARKRSVLVR